MEAVAVVLPMRNAERYVAAAVRSVLNQTHRDLRLVVVDDGSTDRSVQEVEQVADERVQIICGPARGVSAARAAGIAATDESLIAFQDADDISEPQRLACQVTALVKQRLDALGTSYLAFDENDEPIRVALHLSRPDIIATAAYSFNPVCGPSILVRREALTRIGGYPTDRNLAEDYELVCRLLRAGCVVGNLREPLYRYRWHTQSTSAAGTNTALTAAMAEVSAEHRRLHPPKPWRVLPQVRSRADLSAVVQAMLG